MISEAAPEAIPRPVLEAVPAIPERPQERPPVTPGKQPGPATPERLAEFYAGDLASGRVPSKRQIKRDWPVGYDTASDLHDHLAAAWPPPDAELPGLAPTAKKTTRPGSPTSPRKEPVIPHRIYVPVRMSGWSIASAVAAGGGLAVLAGHGAAQCRRARPAGRHGDRLRQGSARQAV